MILTASPMRSTFLLLALLLALAGCGKKGNLYLPDKPAKPQSLQPR